jgi:polar amino acid transport system substrate-binding protein
MVFVYCVVLFLFLIVATGCQNQKLQPSSSNSSTPLEKLRTEHVIDAGYIIYPPAVIKDPNTGKLSGHFVDAIEAIAKEVNATVRYHEVTWATFVPELQSGKFDVTIAATYVTIPRALVVAYTRPLFYLGSAALVRADEKRFSKLEDLNRSDVRIALTQGTAEVQIAEKELKNAKRSVIASPDLNLAFLEVVTGRADATLNDEVMAHEFAKNNSGTKVILDSPPFNMTAVAWPVRQGDQEWVNFLNNALRYLETTGQLQKFEEHYGAGWLHKLPE